MANLMFWSGVALWTFWGCCALALLALRAYGRILCRREIRKSLTEADAAHQRRQDQNARGRLTPWLINHPVYHSTVTGFRCEGSEVEIAERIAESVR